MAAKINLSTSSYATNPLWKAKELRTMAANVRRAASTTRKQAKAFEPYLSTAELHTLAEAARILDALGEGLEGITHQKAREEAKRKAEHEQQLREERHQPRALLFAGKTNREIRAECDLVARYLRAHGWESVTLENAIRHYDEREALGRFERMREQACEEWHYYIQGRTGDMSPEGYNAFKQQTQPDAAA